MLPKCFVKRVFKRLQDLVFVIHLYLNPLFVFYVRYQYSMLQTSERIMHNRRSGLLIFLFLVVGCTHSPEETEGKPDIAAMEKERILRGAATYATAEPITVTDSTSERSAGGTHDFYSEGDYWWPDPDNPAGPYIRKDGMTNPDNFQAHRRAMIRLNQIAGALTSAYLITEDKKYISQLVPHLQAWFVDEETKMNPTLMYGQAIMGKVTGRGIGIIDTVHLIEVARSLGIIQDSGVISKEDVAAIKAWFREYLRWMTTHPFGIEERDNGNNHSVTWALQVAAFAQLVQDEETLAYCRKFYKETLLPDQMNEAGAFPLELERTKPYGYSIFVLDAMTSLCQILSTPDDSLFTYTTESGKNISLGLEFLYPYLKDKDAWPYPKDVMYWEDWPVQQPCLLFGGLAFDRAQYIDLWASLDAEYDTPEVIRNMPIKYPLLWL